MEKGQVFGLNIGELLTIYDRDLQLWKMSECLFTGDYGKYSEALPKSGIMLNGKIFALLKSEADSPVIDYLLLPTPLSSMHKGAVKNRYYGSPNCRGNLEEVLRNSETDPICPNPVFIEKMMGYYIEWTDLEASEMQLSLK